MNIAELAKQQITDEIHHFNIDTNPWIQNLLVVAVEKGVQTSSVQQLEQYINNAASDSVYRFSDKDRGAPVDAVELNSNDVGVTREKKSNRKRWR